MKRLLAHPAPEFWRPRTALGILFLSLGLALNAHAARDPTKSFLENFQFPAYFMPIFPLDGQQFGGDLTATYDQAYMQNKPNLELLIVGEFPRSRFFSITLYDDHAAIIDTLHDAQIEPLDETQGNPFRPGGPSGAEDILYAVRVRLGSGFVTDPVPGCRIEGQSNMLDGRLRHTAGTYYSANQSNFTASNGIPHNNNVTNQGVSIFVRRYLEANDGNTGAFDLTTPVIFVRHSGSGCALNMWDLIGQPQPNPNASISPSDWYGSVSTFNINQVSAHIQHSKDMPTLQPYGLDPQNSLAWVAGAEYNVTSLPDTGYVSAVITNATAPAKLKNNGKVMRMRFRVPTLPCSDAVCPITGDEEIRYWSLSFVKDQSTVVATISDLDLNPNPDGYVDLIISFGTLLPAHVNTANGYSVVQLPVEPIKLITLRNILPASTFDCSGSNVPFKTNEHHPNGGYMGEYAPFVSVPVASTLPQNAVYIQPGGSCEPP